MLKNGVFILCISIDLFISFSYTSFLGHYMSLSKDWRWGSAGILAMVAFRWGDTLGNGEQLGSGEASHHLIKVHTYSPSCPRVQSSVREGGPSQYRQLDRDPRAQGCGWWGLGKGVRQGRKGR